MSDLVIKRPRTAISDSPSSRALVTVPSNSGQIVEFKAPTRYVKPKKLALEEEKFVAALEKIIARDFYPDLAKLQAQNEYLEALESNDMTRLRDVTIRYQTPARSMMTPSTFETPSVAATPRHPHDTPSRATEDNSSVVGENPPPKEGDDIDTSMSLNEFLHKYTSEDNISFEQIVEEAQVRLRKKHSHFFEASSKQQQHLALTADAKLAIKDNGISVPLDTWQHTPTNALMFLPQGADYTDEEKVGIATRGTVKINHSGTRFDKQPFPGGTSARMTTASTDVSGYAPSGPLVVPGDGNASPRVNGFGFVVTPSPAPGPEAMPAMTWGTIDGTPFRLDGGDVDVSAGPIFKIPEASNREKLGLRLAEKVAAKQRASRTPSASSAAGVGVPGTPGRFLNMSPAAQKLTRQMFKGSGTLSPSVFTATPQFANSMTRTRTPLLTPRSGKYSTNTPKVGSQTPIIAAQAAEPITHAPVITSVTDDLLS